MSFCEDRAVKRGRGEERRGEERRGEERRGEEIKERNRVIGLGDLLFGLVWSLSSCSRPGFSQWLQQVSNTSTHSVTDTHTHTHTHTTLNVLQR